MTTDYERILLAEGIGYSEILDPKFKTKIFFTQPLSAATAAGSALATSLLTASNQRYPSIAQLRKKLQMLYGAAIFGSVQREGDIQTNHISATVIDDSYALEQEPLFDEVLELLLDCLFRPNAADGAFSQTEFRIRQQNLLDTIKAEIDEKRTYALNQARRTAFDGEPAALSPCGTAEEVAALTPASAYAAYQELLRTAGIEIYFVGPAKKAGLADKLRRAFAAIPDRKPQPLCAIAPSPAKPEPQEVHELLPVAQCKLVLLWKTAYENPWVLAMLSAVFGGTPSSKLFANVREKMSLCYYCAASYSTFKQSLNSRTWKKHETPSSSSCGRSSRATSRRRSWKTPRCPSTTPSMALAIRRRPISTGTSDSSAKASPCRRTNSTKSTSPSRSLSW